MEYSFRALPSPTLTSRRKVSGCQISVPEETLESTDPEVTMKRRQFISFLGGSSTLMWSSRGRALAGLPFADTAENGGQESATQASPGSTPIAIHPENPKYFIFRGKPRVLIAATEHYGSVVNRRFDFTRYLAEAADKKQNLTRTFLLFRELQSARNPYSPVKPESTDFVTPYPRSGPGRAMDGELKYDLDKWNGEYFERLHRFLSMASDLGIVAELTILSNTYSNEVWALNPLRDKNNLQGIGKVEWPEYTSLRDPLLVERQIAHVRKIIQETSGYDNVYYEICNEPGGAFPNHVTPAEVDAWQEKIATAIRDELRKLNRRHLVVGQNAFSYAPRFYQGFDESFSGSMLDAVNIQPLPNLGFHGRTYQLGNFMSKELQLAEFRDFFLATYGERKPTISDEDNDASMYRDVTGWTIHRKRAWMAVMCGGHYDYIDFSIQSGLEAGTEESRRNIRTWMKNLTVFIHSFDFIHAKPAPGWISTQPAPLVTAALAKPGEDYIAYLADGRELTDPAAGQRIAGPIGFDLFEGTYRACFYSPVAGEYSPGIRVMGGAAKLEIPPFEQDIVLRMTRES